MCRVTAPLVSVDSRHFEAFEPTLQEILIDLETDKR